MTDGIESSVESDYEIALKAMWKECPWPWERSLTIEQCIGKTIKFSKQMDIEPKVIIIVFTDDSFLMINRMGDIQEMNIPFDEDIQDFAIEAGLITKEIVDKKRNFHAGWDLKFEKEYELKELDRLIKKYKS